MPLISGEAVSIAKLCLIGGIIIGAVWYRLHVWRHRRPDFVRALTASVLVFSAFGLGVVMTMLSGKGPTVSVTVPFFAMFAGPSLAYLAYQFWKGRPVSPYFGRAILVFFGWLFVLLVAENNSSLPLVMGASVLFLSFSLGILNGVLGPVVPVIVVAHGLSRWFGGEGSLFDLPFGALVELFSSLLHESLRLLAGIVITVLGLAEFFSFFGVSVKAGLDRLQELTP